jgi:2-dehydropantoate 2-reductase
MAADRLHVAVLGPGGVGGLLAALLARAGDHVVVLAGESTAREIAASGIRVESGKFGNFTASVTAAPQLVEPVDAVLVTVKATHLDDALRRVPASRLGGALVVPFLNGIEHVDRLRAIYPPAQVVPATIRIETTRVAPGVIRHTSPFNLVEIAGAERIAEHLRATGLDVRVRAPDEALQMLWEKFAIIAPLALLTTHARASVGVVRTERREEMSALIAEVVAIASADGVTIDPAAVFGMIDRAHEAMETSMQRDQAAGRPLEIDGLGGALLRRADRAGIQAPVTRRLVEGIEKRPADVPAGR